MATVKTRIGNVRGPRGERGPQGERGERGPQGEKGADGNMTFSDLTEEQKESLRGADGKSAYQYAHDGGFSGTEAEFEAKLANDYLPLSGGTMTGTITLPNNTALKSKDQNGTAQEVIRANASRQVIIGAKDAWDLVVLYHAMAPATSAVDALDIGAAARRWRNLYLSGALSDGTNRIMVADIAKKSDIPTPTTESWTFTLEDGSTVTKAVHVG